MFVKWFRENTVAAIIFTIFRVYLGIEWVKAGWEKVAADKPFDAAGFLKGAVGKSTGEHPMVQGWWATFLDNVAIPMAGLFSFLVAWGELLVGIALIVGIFTTFAALMGITMNFAFMLSGATSTNVQMSLLTIFLLVAGFNAAKYGLDYWVIPYIRKFYNKKDNTANVTS